MTDMNELVDKRRHKRFLAPEGTYAALKSDSVIMGQIINIGKGGLAFRYVANGMQINGTFHVDIFLKGNCFYLKKVPFKPVTDFYFEDYVPFSTIKVKQCGGQFGKLAKSQMSRLDYFIQNYTFKEAC